MIFIASLNKHMHECKHTLVLLTFQVEEKVLILVTIHLQVGIPYNLILLSKCTHSRLVLTVLFGYFKFLHNKFPIGVINLHWACIILHCILADQVKGVSIYYTMFQYKMWVGGWGVFLFVHSI